MTSISQHKKHNILCLCSQLATKDEADEDGDWNQFLLVMWATCSACSVLIDWSGLQKSATNLWGPDSAAKPEIIPEEGQLNKNVWKNVNKTYFMFS